jgi:hypothetical protein
VCSYAAHKNEQNTVTLLGQEGVLGCFFVASQRKITKKHPKTPWAEQLHNII